MFVKAIRAPENTIRARIAFFWCICDIFNVKGEMLYEKEKSSEEKTLSLCME